MKLALTCLLLLLAYPLTHSHANEPVVWGYGHFPPYLSVRQDGQPQGPYAELVREVFSHAGIEYQTAHAPNRRTRQSINAGRVEFAIGPVTSIDNPHKFYLSKVPVANIELRAYWLGRKDPIKQVADLKGQSVILIASYGYSGLRSYIEDPVNEVRLSVDVEDHKRALLALSINRGNYMLGYRKPTELVQLEMNVPDLQSHSLLQIDMYFIIRKSVSNSRHIMDKLEQAYMALYPPTQQIIPSDQ